MHNKHLWYLQDQRYLSINCFQVMCHHHFEDHKIWHRRLISHVVWFFLVRQAYHLDLRFQQMEKHQVLEQAHYNLCPLACCEVVIPFPCSFDLLMILWRLWTLSSIQHHLVIQHRCYPHHLLSSSIFTVLFSYQASLASKIHRVCIGIHQQELNKVSYHWKLLRSKWFIYWIHLSSRCSSLCIYGQASGFLIQTSYFCSSYRTAALGKAYQALRLHWTQEVQKCTCFFLLLLRQVMERKSRRISWSQSLSTPYALIA